MAVLSALDKSEQIFMETFYEAHGQEFTTVYAPKGRVMAMLTLNGLVQNVYTQPASTDRETGEVRPESLRAQIPLRKHHGEWREEARNGHAEGAHRSVQKTGWTESPHPRWRLCEQGRYHVFTRSEMKRNPSRHLEKEKPRERLEPFRGEADF